MDTPSIFRHKSMEHKEARQVDFYITQVLPDQGWFHLGPYYNAIEEYVKDAEHMRNRCPRFCNV